MNNLFTFKMILEMELSLNLINMVSPLLLPSISDTTIQTKVVLTILIIHQMTQVVHIFSSL
jgi:hypothetical protein